MTYPYELELLYGSEGAISGFSFLAGTIRVEEEGDLVRIISGEFNVSNDYDLSGDSPVYRNIKTAYSVVEVKKKDWDTFIEENGWPNPLYFSLMYYPEDPESEEPPVLSPDRWMGFFQVGSNFGVPYTTEDFTEGVYSTKLITTPAQIYNVTSSLAPILSVKVKTIIDGKENTDPTYIPCFTGEVPTMNIECTVEGGGEQVVWDWESGKIGEEDYRYYKFSVKDLNPEYTDLQFGELQGNTSSATGETHKELQLLPGSAEFPLIMAVSSTTGTAFPSKGSMIIMRVEDTTSTPVQIGVIQYQLFNLGEYDNTPVELESFNAEVFSL